MCQGLANDIEKRLIFYLWPCTCVLLLFCLYFFSHFLFSTFCIADRRMCQGLAVSKILPIFSSTHHGGIGGWLINQKWLMIMISTYFYAHIIGILLIWPTMTQMKDYDKNIEKNSKWAQSGPSWSKTAQLVILDPFWPLWSPMECWQAMLVRLAIFGPTPP